MTIKFGHPADIILKPRVTEKTMNMTGGEDKVTFALLVHPMAGKKLIRNAVEKLFKVKVAKVNVVNIKGKLTSFKQRAGRRKNIRKAYITLQKGEKFDALSLTSEKGK